MQFCDNFKMLYAMIYCVAMQLLREIRMTYYYYRGGSVVYRGPLRNRLSMAIRRSYKVQCNGLGPMRLLWLNRTQAIPYVKMYRICLHKPKSCTYALGPTNTRLRILRHNIL